MRTTWPYIHRAVGPRRIGGCYRDRPGEQSYTVVDIRTDLDTWYEWEIVCRDADGAIRCHSTPWNTTHGEVLSQPAEGDER